MTDQSGKEHVSIVICGHVDSGKCFLEGTEILMSDGSVKEVQNIKSGDLVMGDDGTPRRVTSTVKGEDDMYQIVQTKGVAYTVTSDHELVLKASNYEGVWYDKNRDRYRIRWLQNFAIKEKTFPVSAYDSSTDAKSAAETYLRDIVPNFSGYTKYGDVVEITAKKFHDLPKRVQSAFKGFSVGVDFEDNNIDIDPYVLGYWIGDGTSDSPSITTNDPEIVDYFEDFAKSLGLQITDVGNYRYDISTGTNTGGPRRNAFRNFLNDNNLMGNKHIPERFKKSSRSTRLKILAGLVDSDGYNSNNTIDFCFKSEQICDDVIFIARSLGFSAFKKKVKRTCKNGANGPVTGDYYRFIVHGEGLEEIPSLLERKKCDTRASKKNACVTNIEISSVGKNTYYGFETDGNHRFLLSDFTVTHNSTTTGRLIFELGGIGEREMKKLQEKADTVGKSSFAFAFYMDTQKEEQARGVTISCTTKEFHTDSKHYTIIDAPGHRDFIKNMISGSSQADVALLLVPADGNFTTSIAKGNIKAGEVQGQTRQHALLINLLGVKQLIIGVNKMDCDTAGYKQERFEEVKNEMINMLSKVGWKKDYVKKHVPIIPLSGYKGDNLIKKSTNMDWWKGLDIVLPDGPKKGQTVHIDCLVDALDKMVYQPIRKPDAFMCTPVSGVYQIKGVGDVLTGRVEQGSVEPGKEVKFLPTHTDATPCAGKVFTVEQHHKPMKSAGPGHNIGMNVKGLNKGNMPRVGDIMVYKDSEDLGQVTKFVAQVKVLTHPGELKTGYSPIAFVRTSRSAVKMTEIQWKLGKETGMKKLDNPVHLKAGDAAQVVFEPQQPFVVAPFSACEGLGRVAILEGNTVVMLGKVISVERK